VKFIRVVKKNFKLLIRSKASAFTVLIGPLLVILLVGLAFSGKTTYELSIGYYTPQHNNLTSSFTESLRQSHYYVQEFPNEQDCIKKIEQGIIHTCIIFPENFRISNENRSDLRFLVDYSRMNLVYKVIDSVSGILEIESKELSYSLTQALLSRINSTMKDLNSELLLVEGITPKLNLLILDVQNARANTDAMKFDISDVSVESLLSQVGVLNNSFNSLQSQSSELINKSAEWIDAPSPPCGENFSSSEEEEFCPIRDKLLELYNETPEQIQELANKINSLSGKLSQLEIDLNKSKQLNKDTQTKLDSAKNNLANVQSSLLNLKNALIKTKQNLESISITRAETIVSPVNTRIEPIMLETSKLTFTFPFLLVLVIMFVALLLSSTLIMFEKSSKSFFRNHITPTRQEFFVFTTFITSFIVIVVQTLIILGLANYFMNIPLFKNIACTVLLIFIASAFFIVLGMAVGYVFSTQEGAIMASIVLGSIFLFLSNLVVPLESLAPALSNIIKFNPYVLASELLRKSLLFNVNIITEAAFTLALLGGAALLIFLLILLSTALANRKRVRTSTQAVIIVDGVDSAGEMSEQEAQKQLVHEFKAGEKTAASKEELFKLLSDMPKSEFEDNVTPYENKIADWVEHELKDKRLASKLRKTSSRKDMLRTLGGEVKAAENKEEKEEGNEEEEQQK
jgi:ABC-type multidrug transport system permease subunit